MSWDCWQASTDDSSFAAAWLSYFEFFLCQELVLIEIWINYLCCAVQDVDGVLSSWDILARKMLLASFAASAASLQPLILLSAPLPFFKKYVHSPFFFYHFQVDINSVNKLVFVNRLCQVIHSTNLKSSSLKLVTDIGSSQKTIGILLVFFSFYYRSELKAVHSFHLNIKNDKIHSLFKQIFNAFLPN